MAPVGRGKHAQQLKIPVYVGYVECMCTRFGFCGYVQE